MNEFNDRLYQLLPTFHRVKDAEKGYPLRELLSVVADQVRVVEQSIDSLYDNWFIETCAEWVVPYLGELIGYRPLIQKGISPSFQPAVLDRPNLLTARREVANTLRLRRRKGTLAISEQLAASVSGWPARAVEFYALLGLMTHINHVRIGRGGTIDVVDQETLDLLEGPFDAAAHTIDVRRINSRRKQGRHNIPA